MMQFHNIFDPIMHGLACTHARFPILTLGDRWPLISLVITFLIGRLLLCFAFAMPYCSLDVFIKLTLLFTSYLSCTMKWGEILSGQVFHRYY